MGCSKCKEKKPVVPKTPKTTNSFDAWVTGFMICWFLLGCYGLYSLISKLL